MGKHTGIALLAGLVLSVPLHADPVHGEVRDLNGRPVAGAAVTVVAGLDGPTATTVFTSALGRFRFPDTLDVPRGQRVTFALRALGYELQGRGAHRADGAPVLLLAQATSNQTASAPASAWLRSAESHDANSSFILDCVGCHQVPAVQARRYANAIAEIPGGDRPAQAKLGWEAMVKYMNFISAQEFSRGSGHSPDAVNVYSVGNGPAVTDFLARRFPGRMDRVSGYDWGAPLAVNDRTVIREYELPRPNAIREAVLLGKTGQLYVADVATNRILKLDPATGRHTALEVPFKGEVGPHTLHRAPDGALWVAPFVTSVVARLDPVTETWQTWPMRTKDGKPVGIHDLTAGANHELLTDKAGRIWFSDIVNDAVGYLDPKNGKVEIYPAPKVKGRERNGGLYGIAMSKDRDRIWYSEVNIGHVGSFNVRTRKYETSIVLPENSGPRRVAIGDDDTLYVALYGSGQLLAYDTKARRQIGIYDLPDRASAPYATTWDPLRKVVWIPTSNADVIYRFDPRDASVQALPLPRQGAFLRMVDVDPASGQLVTSYANIVEQVHGPRMAVMIDPGDGVRGPASAVAAATTTAAAAPLPLKAPVPPPVVTPAPVPDGDSLQRSARCHSCHHATDMLIGPPWQAIAQRHAPDRAIMEEVLARKIVQGGGGNWGVVPMVPNEHVKPAEARALARWILDQVPGGMK
jgi:streptogramin lyase/cytochrome c551/c552